LTTQLVRQPLGSPTRFSHSTLDHKLTTGFRALWARGGWRFLFDIRCERRKYFYTD
jgi:hypothetical protein